MTARILTGDARTVLATLPDESVHMICTSPPYYGLRAYLPADHPDKALEMGGEPTLSDYIAGMVALFREARRVLRVDGVMFLNVGDAFAATHQGRQGTQHGESFHANQTYAQNVTNLRRPKNIPIGLKPKDLLMVPARLAIALCDDGWWLRSQLPWVKRSTMPEAVTDRPSSAIEYVYLLSKSAKYFYDADAIRRIGAIPAGTLGAKASAERAAQSGVNSRPAEYATYSGTRNFRNTDLFFESLTAPHGAITDAAGGLVALDVNTAGFAESHFATFPVALIEPLIRAGCPPGGTVLDPFLGAGTTALVADRLGRNSIGIELNPAYAAMARARVLAETPLFTSVESVAAPAERQGALVLDHHI